MPATYPNLLRPAQVAENNAEISRLEETIRLMTDTHCPP